LVRYRGYLRAEPGADSVARVVALLGSDEVHLVADLLDLERYDSAVRQRWQSEMLPRRTQLKSVAVGASSALVRMGVTAFGAFLGMPVRVHGTHAALDAELRHACAL
jgi:hypothetical protein